MIKSYEKILKEIIDSAKIEDVFDLRDLQTMQDEFACSLGIASVITDTNGVPVTRPSNFTCLCADYVRRSEEGMRQCAASDAAIGATKVNQYYISKCLSAGLIDGGVSFHIGTRHIGNWLFGQIRYENEMLSDEEIRNKSSQIDVSEVDFKREYLRVPVIEKARFEHIANFASIIAKKFSEEAYLKCVNKAEQVYKSAMERSLEERELLEQENAFDYLTKVLTRNYFEQEIKNLEKSQILPISVIVADVNNLKLTNDIFGHKFGDALLAEIAAVMRDESFDGYIIGRCGGDEFNILIPGGKRSAADWFCHRVNIELSKCYDCCIIPSVAFGIGKKDKLEEKLKNVIEVADYKMYNQKLQQKKTENFIDSLRAVMLGRKRLTEEIMDEVKQFSLAFADYLGFNDYKKNLFIHLNEIHDFGSVILTDELFAKRFDLKLSIEERRELSKIPIINQKIAALYPEYANTAKLQLNFYENWDGSGLPNGMSGFEIAELSRCGRILCDYLYFGFEAPIGLNMTKEKALKRIVDNAGKLYDPDFVGKFRSFINKYN